VEVEQRRYRFKNKRIYWRVPDEIRAEIIRLAAHGATSKEICSRVPVSRQTVLRLVGPLGGVLRAERWRVSDARLSVDERVEIALGVSRGESYRAIAARIGRAPSTVCREVTAGEGAPGIGRWWRTAPPTPELDDPSPPGWKATELCDNG
jgi:transposase, IS30 family